MLTKDIQENFPFLSVVTYGGIEYIGIIINQDATVTSMYIYTDIRSEKEQKAFLALGDVWWWESNRLIPINIFLKKDFVYFKICLSTFIAKDCEVLAGPQISLKNISEKRVKKRSIQLVKKANS